MSERSGRDSNPVGGYVVCTSAGADVAFVCTSAGAGVARLTTQLCLGPFHPAFAPEPGLLCRVSKNRTLRREGFGGLANACSPALAGELAAPVGPLT